MSENQTEFGEGRPERANVKQMRREHPSGWMELAKDPSRALLIDAILDSPHEYEFTPPEIGPRAGISDESVRNHINELEKTGIVREIESGKYRIDGDSRVLMEIEELNSAVTAVLSAMADKQISGIDPDQAMDNSTVDTHNGPPVDLPNVNRDHAN